MAAYSSNRRFPEFFKVYLPEHSSQRLLIPDAFLRFCNRPMPKNAVFSNHMGRLWHVIVDYVDGGVFFLNGWSRFVRDNSIECGDFLTFKYNGQCGFSVKIFGNSACEKTETNANGTVYMNEVKLEEDEEVIEKGEDKKRYNNDGDTNDVHDGDSDGDDNDESDDEDYIDEEEEENSTEEEEAPRKSRAGKQSGVNMRGYEKRVAVKVERNLKQTNAVNVEEEEDESTIKRSRPRKHNGGNNGKSKKRAAVKVDRVSKRTHVVNIEEEDLTTKKSKAQKQSGRNNGGPKERVVVRVKEEVTTKGSKHQKNCCENKGVCEEMPVAKVGRSYETNDGVPSEQVEVSKYIQPQNPFFISKLRGSKKHLLPVPVRVLKLWKLTLPNSIILQNEHGRQWLGTVINWTDGRIWITGWKDFCIGNRVAPDDWCICEFPRGCNQVQDVIKVHTVRNSGSIT